MTRELIEDFTKIVKPFVQKKLLEENFEGMGEQDKAEFGRDFDEILSLAIKGLESSTWIPVTERLPEDSHAVLVWCPERKNIYCAYREVNQWWIFGAYFEKVTFKVTAWMPLPKQYKKENEDKR